MRQRPKRRRNDFQFESLEARLALTGNVTAVPDGGTLIITGDSSANGILVERIDADSFRITGLGTKVNGSFSAKQINGIVNGIGIDMRGGSDSVTLKNLTVPGAGLGILLGGGNDALVLSNVRVNGVTAIDAGTGNDAIVIDQGTFRAGLAIKTRGGNDSVAITRSTVTGPLDIQLDAGTDALSMVSVNVVDGPLPILPVIEIPENFQILEEAFLGNETGAIILGGSGVDSIALNNVQIDGLTQIDTAGSVDTVSIANSRFGNELEAVPAIEGTGVVGLEIRTGDSSDAVAIANTTVIGHLLIDTTLGSLDQVQASVVSSSFDGNDSVALAKVTVLTALPEGLPTDDQEEVGEYESGDVTVYTGNGTDAVSFVSVTTDSFVAIYTTDGSSNDGNDTVAISNSTFNRLGVVESLGTISIPQLDSGLYIATGAGIDAVTIAKVNVTGRASIFTEDDTDRVAISLLHADQIYVDLGNGNNDALTVTNSSAEEALFFGGLGSGDTLVRANNTFGFQSPPPSNGFETIV
jgi:hypothetical protein